MDNENADDRITDDKVSKDMSEEKLEAISNVVTVNPESLAKLCNGFLGLYVDEMKFITNPLDELNRNQEVLIETILQENSRFDEAKQSLNLEEMFSRVAQYQTKLVGIKKDMVAMHEKAVKLKKRSLKLQTSKEKESRPKESSAKLS